MNRIYGNMGKDNNQQFFSHGTKANFPRLAKDIIVLIICLVVGFYSIRSVRYYFRGMEHEDASCVTRGTCPAKVNVNNGGLPTQALQDVATLLSQSAAESKDGQAPAFSLTPEQQAFLLNHYLKHQSDKQ